MDQRGQYGAQPSTAGHDQHQSQMNQTGLSPGSTGAFTTPDDSSSAGLGLSLDARQQQQPHQNLSFTGTSGSGFESFISQSNQSQQAFSQSQGNISDTTAFDPTTNFSQQTTSNTAADDVLAFDNQSTGAYLPSSLNEGDFSLFPAGSQGNQFNSSLFEQPSLSPNDIQSSAPFSQHNQFSSPPHSSGHSRNVSLGPEAALLPNKIGDWTRPQFQGHRRTPSEFSDVSSVAPSPNIISADSFEDHPGHSPLQRPSDGSLYQDVLNIESFSIGDNHHGRSPSHSPAMSPRVMPQQMPEMHNQPTFGLTPPPSGGFRGIMAYPGMPSGNSSFPSLATPQERSDVPHMAPPSINIDFAPNNAKQGSYAPAKSRIDQDSLTPPERGRVKSRPRSVTDPFQPGGAAMGGSPRSSGSLSPTANLSARSESSRSLSPLDREGGSSSSRRRQSTSAVPNNVIALRLADPEYQSSQDAGSAKRVQKHPATFQCTLCPKRFTRAYNLRSHLRTHTDERPFVCTVCGKAFARQHDRKRHESLHSGEKRFVCKGDLKAGGQWGCGRRFARADALGRHFRSEAGRVCIKPLLDEEMVERQRQWQEQRLQQNMTQNMAAPPPMVLDPSTGFPIDASGNYALPAALLQQYPALAQMNWSAPDAGGGMEDNVSGRSSYDASDYEGDDGGYVSGPGTGYGEGGMGQNFGDMGYASDFGGR